MNNIKAITHVPGWMELIEASDRISREYNAYAAVPLVYRAIMLRCNSLSSTPAVFYNGETEIEWGFDTPWNQLIWKTEASLLLTGAAYWLKSSSASGVLVKNVYWLNPYSMSVDYNDSTGEFTFIQRISGRTNTYSADDIVYFREFDPTQDVEPGIAPAGVALEDSREMHYMTRFAARFFEGGAMPVTILGMEQVSDSELKRVEGVFQRLMGGIKNAFKIIGVRANAIDIKPITPPLKDLTMPELYDQSKKNIANAFGVPVTMLEDPSANRATAAIHHYSFWSETIRPRGDLYENVINQQLLGLGGLRFEFDFDSLDVFQEDEAQRSASLLNLVNARIPADVAVEILGFDLTDEQLQRIKDAQETRDEQREQIIENTSTNTNKQPDIPDEEQDDGQKAFREDLLRWRKNALTRLSQGKNPAKMFVSDVIPQDIISRMYTILRLCKTAEDIEETFDKFLDIEAVSDYSESPDIGELVDALREAVKVIQDAN